MQLSKLVADETSFTKMNPKFLKRLKRFGPHYQKGSDLACFTVEDFNQIRALMFELGLDDHLEILIATSKDVARKHPDTAETTSVYPINVRGLPPNPYKAKTLIGSLMIFVNRAIDVDAYMTICLPVAGMELDAILFQASMHAEFCKKYNQKRPPELALIEKP